MMGWIVMAAIGVALFVILRLTGIPRRLTYFVVAALTLGAAGYAWQQRAALPAHPVSADAKAFDVDPGMVAFRSAIMPGAADAPVLAAADAQLRAGDAGAAVRELLAAIRSRPKDATLWTGLGSALVAHDGGQMSPAAQFAFRRALRLAPDQPGPPFFLGMGYVQAGELGAARTAWLRALSVSPADAPYRLDIAERLMLLDQFQAMAAAAGDPVR